MSETVTLSIDGKDVTVPKGTSVIEATEILGIEVPRFCWHPGLSVAGVCRFCMVKIDGVPKLQIACNTTATDGMKVFTQSAEVKEAHKWALEFHLINHPLDCPICDQAGECELQNYYMKVGKYDSQMDEDKILKPKALDVGDNLVLDTERCILCSRCVRFEDEVTKTSSLGIFNRGDHAVIGTFPNRRVQHNYSYNLVDICPVGAFTAKDFRFKCRVWFLKETKTICPGCSTGCNVTLYENKNKRQYYRLKPRKNMEVNGHWMCDYGRTMYEHLNAENRLGYPLVFGQSLSWAELPNKFSQILANAKDVRDSSKVALVVTPQYTNQEYAFVLDELHKYWGFFPTVYVWRDINERIDDFDNILLRGDRNPNTKGLLAELAKRQIEGIEVKSNLDIISTQKPVLTIVLGPEIAKSYSHFTSDLSRLAELPNVVYFGTSNKDVVNKFSLTVPTKVFAEKEGTYTNYKGLEQKLKANPLVFPAMLGIEHVFGEV